ncbi:DUF4998 domain-containing protein [Compostibacter hankyongensis]|uniref:DUF4998 domain-containing protein n=1 Tax=Compostibacter hankyongensis TaxID=1007089 RepID=A0ABP8FH85_9BACT
MDATYEGFLKGGEHIYRELPDSIQVFPGHNRIKISWQLLANPAIVKGKIFWNNGKDSVEVPVSQASGKMKLSAVINSLDEGSYTFEIYTYDKAGNASIPVDTTGNVYGDAYISSLANRLIQNASIVGDKVKILWYKAPEGRVLGTELSFTDQDGDTHLMEVPTDSDTTTFNIHPQGDSLKYRTLYIPDSLAIDTFYTAYQSLKLEPPIPLELNKSGFSEFPLPTDAALYSATTVMPNLWDNDPATFYETKKGSGSPHWFTFDMGVTASLDHYTLWQRGNPTSLFYANSSPRKWEIWGSNDPNPDGSWDDSWTLLGSFESVKPSGQPLNTNTDEDIAQAQAGDAFAFPAPTKPVRYLRIKILQTWDPGGSDHAFISDITLYGTAE